MKKQQQTPKNKPLAENYIHIFNGKVQQVAVAVHINYAEGYISLIDPNPENPAASFNNGKQWKFAKRGLEYMQGWQDILDAMKSAITEAKEKLETYKKEEEERKEALMIEMGEAAMKIKQLDHD